jgi:hypothetical protein
MIGHHEMSNGKVLAPIDEERNVARHGLPVPRRLRQRHRAAAGPEFEVRQPDVGENAEDLHAFQSHEKVAVPQHRRIELAIIGGGIRHLVKPEETISLRFARPPQVRSCGHKVTAQQRDGVDDGMQMDDYLAAHPVDVVTALAAQRPCHSRERAWVALLAVIFVGADVSVLTEGAPHIAGGEKDRARACVPR